MKRSLCALLLPTLMIGTLPRAAAQDIRETFANPPELFSKAGRLEVVLEAKKKQIAVADQTVTTTVYNGSFVPPVLRVRPGDTLALRLVNATDRPTNLHFHGLNVSPRKPSDDIFVHVMPGQSFDYRIRFPVDHPPGLFWFHPHMHGDAEEQVQGGLSGGLIVEGLLDPVPALAGITERIMLLKDLQVTDEGTSPDEDDLDSNAGTTRTVNGQVNPVLSIRPGEIQLWRIANIGANITYRLALDGHHLYRIARDGNRQIEITADDEILLAPSSRVEVLVQGGAPGLYRFRTLPYSSGPEGDQYPEATLATLVSQGAADGTRQLPKALPGVADLRGEPIARHRTVTFTETEDSSKFFINGRQFDANRVDTTAKLGDVEEWTIANRSDEMHVFHIHQLDFQVVERDGRSQPFVGRQDTVLVPPRAEAKILIPFVNPVILGKFVYHCHILEHEDKGMMAVVEVVP